MAEKTCFGRFVELIPSILAKEPMTTPELYEPIKNKASECITNKKCNHRKNGKEENQYEWQHSVRRAQYELKKRGAIQHVDDVWYVPDNPGSKDEAEEREVELIYEKQDPAKIRDELRSLTPKEPEYEEINGIKLKRDNATVGKLKILRGFRCQICGTRIMKKDGTFYAEGAHIKPKREGFPETPDNILILCPNHHKEFDLGKREVLEYNAEYVRFLLNGKEYRLVLSI